MIKGRNKPHALATRALIRAGTGHKYWSLFPQSVQDEIEKTARSAYDVLFEPALVEPLRTLDLPVAGRGYSQESPKMIYELVSFVNHVPENVEDDTTGDMTLEYLRRVNRVSSLVSGTESRSLGLHPVVYFYGATGRFQATAFLAAVEFVRELEERNGLALFTRKRERFEEFLLENRSLTNQVGRQKGAGTRGVPTLLRLYRTTLAALDNGKTNDEIIEELREQFEFIKEPMDAVTTGRQAFSRGVKSAAFLREAIEGAPRCSVCNARLHSRSISYDHRARRADGGLGTLENAQLAHPYCNTGYKESLVAASRARV